jgi:hypothetical protein
MSNTLQQHHFNAIIYYAGEIFAMEMQLEAAKQHCLNTEDKLTSQLLSEDVTDVLNNRKAIRQETRDAGKQLSEQYNLALQKGHEYRLLIEKDYLDAQNTLRTYLTNYAHKPVREQIYQLITQARKGIQTIDFDTNPFWIDNNAYTLFIKQLANSLNQTYNHTYTYQEPVTNHFLMTLLAHPLVRGGNSLSLIGGLAALTVGILATAGIITGLPIATVSTLITAGAIVSATAIALITCSFFRHRSPDELAARSEKISVPGMTSQTVQINPLLGTAANDANIPTAVQETTPSDEERPAESPSTR